MMDQYFGNDSLEPFESIFIGTTSFLIAFIWLSTVLVLTHGVGYTQDCVVMVPYQWVINIVHCDRVMHKDDGRIHFSEALMHDEIAP